MNDQLINHVEDEVADNNFEKIDLQEDSAGCYERRWKYRIKSQRANLFAVAGLYLILISVAIVVV